MSTERVQKILAQTGIASRRKAEELITEGLVTINGKVAKLGDKAELGTDAIKVKGKLLQAKAEEPMYLAFNKPMGVISMLADPQGRPTLADFLTKVHTRIFPIGRLDFNSEGLILLTNDGALTESLQKRDDIPRVYHVKVRGHVTHEMLQRLVRGMRMDRKIVKPHSVRVVQEMAAKSRIEIVFLNSGVVDVKAFFEQKGFLIERMTRTAIGHLTISGIEPGQYKMLDKSQVDALLAQPELGLKKLEANIAKAKPLRGREERIEGELLAETLRKSGKPRQVVRPLFSAPRGASKISGAFGDRKRSDEFERENGTSGRAGGPNKFAEQSGVKRSGASKFGSG
ncbi:MAG: rRNA pseudouridine synthase, partial [Methylotenera sp.]|nr:rRNA pseudouridine synthase [Oligoflexia bacterium]